MFVSSSFSPEVFGLEDIEGESGYGWVEAEGQQQLRPLVPNRVTKQEKIFSKDISYLCTVDIYFYTLTLQFS